MKQLDQLLQLLRYVSRNSGVTAGDIQNELGISERTTRRLIATGKRYGCRLEFTRHPNGGGEWSVGSWGVFDPRTVARYLRRGSSNRG